MKQRNWLNNSAATLLIVLFVFLPFSSWLVSLSGRPSVSLVRDILVVLLFLLGLINLIKKNIKINYSIVFLSALFLVWGVLTFFWREASAIQWLRGIRFTFIPILLLLSLQLFNFKEDERNKIYWSVFFSSFIIVVLAVLEFFKIKLPLTSELSGEGALTTWHGVGGEFPRLESVLAGPNALGLYILSAIGTLVLICKKQWKLCYILPLYFLILLFSYSRSSLVGFIVFALMIIFYAVKSKFGKKIALALFAFSTILFLALVWVGYHSTYWNSLITHGASSTSRVEQYRRVWDQKNEIGLLGRGMGTAGPSSQNRIDNGPNHWTENIYLDMSEETGAIGLLLFLCLIFALGWKLSKNGYSSKVAFCLLVGYALAGLFINIYTGQAGIYILVLILSLA